MVVGGDRLLGYAQFSETVQDWWNTQKLTLSVQTNGSRGMNNLVFPNRLRCTKTQISVSFPDGLWHRRHGGYVKLKDMTDEELAVLGQETYGKEQWSEADVRLLRECWDEYQRRGEDTITLFRPAYSNVLTFHEIDSGEVGVDDVQLLERAGAGIAADYRQVVRKLRAAERIQEQSQHRAVTEPQCQ